MLRWSMIVWFLVACVSSNAAAAKCTLGQLAEFPVTMTPRGPAAAATLDGTSVVLSVNSGDTFSVISSAEAKILRLKPSALPRGVEVYSGQREINAAVARVEVLGLGAGKLKGVDFIVGGDDNRTASLTSGSLGQNILRARDTEYDLSEGVIRLLQPTGCGNEPLAYWSGQKPYSVMDIESADGLISPVVSKVKVDGVWMRARFNTGVLVSVLSSRAASRAGVRMETMAAGSASLTRRVASIDSIKFGDETIMNTQVQVADLGPDWDMIIGDDFLLSHRVYMAFSQNRIYMTYTGGPVFNLKSEPVVRSMSGLPDTPASDVPKDADGFGRRAAIAFVRGQNQAALDDLDQACLLAPNAARYFSQRAAVHRAMTQPALAMADLDTVLKLTPDDAGAHVDRAALRVAQHENEGARQDLDAAASVAPKEADLRFRMGRLYADIDQFGAALTQLDLWIAAHRDDERFAYGMNSRCWTRALAARELDQALADCNTAVGLTQRAPDVLDSRGLVYLRRNEFRRAIADYNAALARKPTIAWSLYGRGLAELKTGAKAQGSADLAAAKTLAPLVAERAVRLGLAP